MSVLQRTEGTLPLESGAAGSASDFANAWRELLREQALIQPHQCLLTVIGGLHGRSGMSAEKAKTTRTSLSMWNRPACRG